MPAESRPPRDGEVKPSAQVAKRARSRIDARLAEVPIHLNALRNAMAEIGEGFETEELEAAYASSDPHRLNHALALERGFEVLQNYIVELVVNGLILAGRRHEGERLDAPRDLRRAAEAGAISPGRRDVLIRTQRIRNLFQHEYTTATHEQVHEAVTAIVAELPGFVDDYARWLDQLRAAS